MGYIAGQLLDKQEREKLATMFQTFDKNHDGRLDINELKEGYEKMKKIVSPMSLRKYFHRLM